MLITFLMLIFSKFFSFIFLGKFGLKIWSSYGGRLLYAYFDFDVYFFKGFVIHIILGKSGNFQNIMGKFYSILFFHIDGIKSYMENNRFWDEIFSRNLWMANFSKNYTVKP